MINRKDDVPFIGSDDIHYEFSDGNKFVVDDDKFYASFTDWYCASESFGLRSERIVSEVGPDDTRYLIEWLKVAFEAGRRLGFEEGALDTMNEFELDI